MADPLSVNVTADATQLNAQLAVARSAVKQYSDEVKKAAQAVRGASDDMKSSLNASLDASATKLGTARVALAGVTGQAKEAAAASKTAAAALGNLGSAAGEAAHGSAGITREFIVMGHEAMQGRFSRIPGSMMVLAEKVNLAHLAVAALSSPIGIAGIAIAALAAGFFILAERARDAANALREVASAAVLAGQNGQQAAAAAKGYADQMTKTGLVGKTEAVDVGAAVAMLTNLTVEQRAKIAALGPGLFNAWGDDAKKTVENITHIFASDTSAKRYADEQRLLSAEQQASWEKATTAAERNGIVVDALSARLAKPIAQMAELKAQQEEQLRLAVESGGMPGPQLQPAVPLEKPNLGDFQPGTQAGPPPPDVSLQTAAYQKIGEAAKVAADTAYTAAVNAGKGRLAAAEAETKAEIAIYQAAASNMELSDRQRGEAAAQVAHLHMSLVKDEATAGVSAAKQSLEGKLASISAEQAADRENFTKVMQLEQQKLALLRASYGERSKQYQDELKTEENMQREHNAQLQRDALEEINKEAQVAKEGTATKKAELETQVTDGEITKKQEIAQLREFEEAQFAANIAALQNFATTWAAYPEIVKKANDEIRELTARNATDMANLNKQAVTAMEQQYSGLINPVKGAFDKMFEGITTGQEKISVAAEKAAGSMIISYAKAAVQTTTDWVIHQLLQLVATQTTETGKTAAVVAGNVIRTASTDTAAIAASAASKAVGGPTVIADAAKAFSGTYASVAQIPYVGWILAPAAGAAAFAAVAAYESLASFETGTDYVPHDMPAFIHQGEAVLNRGDAAAWRSGATSNQNAVSLHYAPVFSGTTPAGLPAQARNEADSFKSYVTGVLRNGQLKLPGR